MRPTYRGRRQVLFPLWGSGPNAGSGKPNAGRTRAAHFVSAAASGRTRPTSFASASPGGRIRPARFASAARGRRAGSAERSQRAAAHD
jgi:hypothetical protein